MLLYPRRCLGLPRLEWMLHDKPLTHDERIFGFCQGIRELMNAVPQVCGRERPTSCRRLFFYYIALRVIPHKLLNIRSERRQAARDGLFWDWTDDLFGW